MNDLFQILRAELAAFFASADSREFLISRCEKFFDQVVKPIDLPGPDPVIDPLLRAAIRPLVGVVYDELVRKMPLLLAETKASLVEETQHA